MASIVRFILAVVAVVLVLFAAASICCKFRTTPDQIHMTDYDDYRRTALEMVRERATGRFGLGIALLGALWSVAVVSKDSHLKTMDWQEVVMFAASNTLMGGFFYFHDRYVDLLAQLFWDMGPSLSKSAKFADVMNSAYVTIHEQARTICFYFGLVGVAITVFSSCLLRRKP